MKTTPLKGKLYLIPTTLGENNPDDVLPQTVKRAIDFIGKYIVENEKTARKFIKAIHPEKVQADLKISLLNKRTEATEHKAMLSPCLNGENIGLMSEAGCPGVADPGAVIVKLAHENGIQVVPLVGPSSILLAMMASGMNGQSFAFNGYLPIDREQKKKQILFLENQVQKSGYSQIFMETPYRNNQLLEDLIKFLNPNTKLCIAANINHPTEEFIKTLKISDWKNKKPELHKIPAVFVLGR